MGAGFILDDENGCTVAGERDDLVAEVIDLRLTVSRLEERIRTLESKDAYREAWLSGFDKCKQIADIYANFSVRENVEFDAARNGKR